MLPYNHVAHLSECNHQQDLSLLKLSWLTQDYYHPDDHEPT